MKAAAWTLGSPSRLKMAEQLAGLAGKLVNRLRPGRSPGGRPVIGRLPWPGSRWTDARDLPAQHERPR
jgi:L-lactate dehydrogenase complex protein LldF